MASIEKRFTADGDARYDVRYRTPSGKQKSQVFARAKDAQNFKRAVEADLMRSTWIDPKAGTSTFKTYAERWVRTRTTKRGALAPRTVSLYRQQLKDHIYDSFGDTALNRITSSDVRDWYSGLVGTGHQVMAAKSYRLLRAIMATAVEDDLIVKNPVDIKGAGVERSKERPTATAQQLWDAAEGMPEHLQAWVLTSALIGLRFSELAGLARRHVDLLHGTVTVQRQHERIDKDTAEFLGIEVEGFGPPKSDAGYRTLAIPPSLVPILEEHLARFSQPGVNGLVFCGVRGGAITRGNFHRMWAPARDAAGLPEGFRAHDFRHTSMTAAAETGASTKELMRRLGQSSPAAAIRYQHATDRRDKELAEGIDDRLARPSQRPSEGTVTGLPGSAVCEPRAKEA